jgi:tRNA-binding EMAP/Myf-like protein
MAAEIKEKVSITIAAGEFNLNELEQEGQNSVLSALFNGAAALKARGVESAKIVLTLKYDGKS